jgi:predicted O-methyltransferase YrrM
MLSATVKLPDTYSAILSQSKAIQFSMPSDLETGSLIRSLTASKPGGIFLDIGTGTGLSLSWMADGADAEATIISVDNNEHYQQIARSVFDGDSRVSVINADGATWLNSYRGPQFDLIFADAWPGKLECLDKALSLVKKGGFYLVDDLLPQANWPDGHQPNVDRLMETLQSRTDFVMTTLNWSTGLYLMTKTD